MVIISNSNAEMTEDFCARVVRISKQTTRTIRITLPCKQVETIQSRKIKLYGHS